MKDVPVSVRYATYIVLLLALAGVACAQTETATLSGTVMDRSGAVISGVQVQLTNSDTNVKTAMVTNAAGIYVASSIKPGRYRMTVMKQGFKQVAVTNLILNVQDVVSRNFTLDIGAASESITVTAEAQLVETTSSVATVVDSRFVQNMPLNGRSVNTLFQLTPGVVLAKTDFNSQGQFSVNGQRTDSNYFMVDGVAANVGVSAGMSLGQSAAGTQAAVGASGGTSSLASIDALQEFRIQTSNVAPEFGRVPGAQISMVTRSGTSEFHGSLFEFFRNDVLDARDWFAKASEGKKPALRQNDFGGTLGGPLVRDKAFFFFSHESLRLRQPKSKTIQVPSAQVRAAAGGVIKDLFNAFPMPNGAELGGGAAEFTGSYSEPSNLDATSLRLDYTPSSQVTLFGRYNYSKSDQTSRGSSGLTLSTSMPTTYRTHTLTLGATSKVSSAMTNDLRFNWSKSSAGSAIFADTFGGAVPISASLIYPTFTSPAEGSMNVYFLSSGSAWQTGANVLNRTRQFNIIDTLSATVGSHQLKFGFDYRRLMPFFGPRKYSQSTYFDDFATAVNGVTSFSYIDRSDPFGLIYSNYSAFAQDTWQAASNLTFTYGVRWEINPPPIGDGKPLYTVNGLADPATMKLAPAGTPLYKTKYGNIAPRFGVSYRLSKSNKWQNAIRGGVGLFYDLGSSRTDLAMLFPYLTEISVGPSTFPLSDAVAAPPSLSTDPPINFMGVNDPDLELPRSMQWNVTFEQSLGTNQGITAGYVGSVGRRLLKFQYIVMPNPDFMSVWAIRNGATSDYNALQLQYNRRMSRGLQVLASYTWAKALDDASDDALDFSSRARGPSNFDVKHTFSGAVSYDIPSWSQNPLLRGLLGSWSIDTILQARSAPPINIVARSFAMMGGGYENIRPDVVPGVPFKISDPSAPGGWRLNKAAFTTPPAGRQGNLGRNGVRGFAANQIDFTLRRQFAINERVKLQFRSDFFNLFNHPNFADPRTSLTSGLFGRSTQTLAASLGAGGINGGFSPLYQIGGPRSIQLALKLQF
ncbi:MAG TPA: carboxypeptidase regulatory-like domain-containing protein [Clostridia bacterium]|nr:carboxypeptidase regulatory-like domain-containing protein [Clostridia bacterium]